MGLRAWWRRNFGKDISTFTDDQKVEAYTLAGGEIGSAVSCIYLGECIGFDKLLDQWEVTERAYSALGFRTLSIDDFTSYARDYGTDVNRLLRVPRKQGEPVVLHAAYYREHFFRKVGMHEAVKKALGGEVAVGNYVMPSTDHLKQG
jgi:hypothetical protein